MAFSDICTHLGCRVNWHPEVQNYVSPCHDGHFEVSIPRHQVITWEVQLIAHSNHARSM